MFRDARALLALGRGSVGSGRLKSEAYVADRLDEQLADMEAEIVTRREMVRIDLVNNHLSVSPLFSWREREFRASYMARADARYIERSPVERAVLGLLAPIVLPLESDFLMKNQFSRRLSRLRLAAERSGDQIEQEVESSRVDSSELQLKSFSSVSEFQLNSVRKPRKHRPKLASA